MEQWIKTKADTFWLGRKSAMLKEIHRTVKFLEDIIKVDHMYRGDRSTSEHVKGSMGGFASQTINFSQVASILGDVDKRSTVSSEQIERMTKLLNQLQIILQDYDKKPPVCCIINLDSDVDSIIRRYDDHMQGISEIFMLLRKAELEVKGRYEKARHQEFFTGFNWRSLNNIEMGMSPPFIVLTEAEKLDSRYLGTLLGLLTCGRPIKVFVIQKNLNYDSGEVGREAALKLSTDIGMLGISLRNAFVLQGSSALPEKLAEGINEGLDSPRPSLISINAEEPQSTNIKVDLMQLMIHSRAFVHFSYNPDRHTGFVSCLNLEGNPNLNRMWSRMKINYINKEGREIQVDYSPTFADYLLSKTPNPEHYQVLKESAGDIIPLADYIKLSHADRAGKTPYVCSIGPDRQLKRLAPPKGVIAKAVDKADLWRSLQELSGVDNPFIKDARAADNLIFKQEKEQALSDLKATMESKIQEREVKAVKNAMRNLAMNLTGLEVSGDPMITASASVDKSSRPASSETAPESVSSEAAEASETVWLETALCTTCDECTEINNKIFAYNSDKKAIIKDPRGGPFKDIVKAAEKCSARIIHPGKPWDLQEKGVDKLIQRAQAFQ